MKTSKSVTQHHVERDTASVTPRARAPFLRKGCHGVTRDTSCVTSQAGRDSDTRPPDGAGVTITPVQTTAVRQDLKDQFRSDPRFAAWNAGTPVRTGEGSVCEGLNLGPLELATTPEQQARIEERRELFRIAGQAALDRSRGGRDLDPEARAWAKHYASAPPLNRPMGNGEPDAA